MLPWPEIRRGLKGEYRNPLAKLDTKFHGMADGQVGSLVRRLESYGKLICLVMGTFQEGSKDRHSLLDLIVDFKLRARGLAREMEGTKQERSIILLNLRRELSIAVAKAQCACILGRVARLYEGHRQAAKIRVWVRREEEMREEAIRAHWLVNIRGRGIIMGRGEFIVQ